MDDNTHNTNNDGKREEDGVENEAGNTDAGTKKDTPSLEEQIEEATEADADDAEMPEPESTQAQAPNETSGIAEPLSEEAIEEGEATPEQKSDLSYGISSDDAAASEKESREEATINSLDDVRAGAEETKDKTPKAAQKHNMTSTSNIATIRTFESDSQEAIQQQKTSMADIAMAEQEKREREPEEQEEQQTQIPQESSFWSGFSFKKGVVVSLSIFFFVAAAAIGGYIYYFHGADTPFERNTVAPQEIVFANDRIEIQTTGRESEGIVNEITKVRSANIPSGSITNVYFTRAVRSDEGAASRKTLVGPETFVEFLDTRIPASLVRTFTGDFMLGYHGQQSGPNEPFLLFEVSSYENAFAATLLWEGSMEEDLLPLIGPRPQPTTSAAGTRGTSTATTSPPAGATSTLASATQTPLGQGERTLLDYYTDRPFVDRIIQNRDTRALELPSGDMRLVYAFPRQNILLITTNRGTLVKIFERLSRRQFTE